MGQRTDEAPCNFPESFELREPPDTEVDGLELLGPDDEVAGVPPAKPHAQHLSLLQLLDGEESCGGREVGVDYAPVAFHVHPDEAGAKHVGVILIAGTHLVNWRK